MMVALTLYGLAGLLGVLWTALVFLPISAKTSATTSAASGPELAGSQLGMVRGGPRRALAAAVTELYAAGAVIVSHHGSIARGASRLPAGTSELARAVYGALAMPRTLPAVRLRPRVRQALADTTTELARWGLVPTTGSWRAARAIQLLVAVLVVVASTRAGALPPALLLPAPLVLAATVAAWWVPRRTGAGYHLLRRLRQEQAARWQLHSGTELIGSWTPGRAAEVNALTGMVLTGLEPALRRGARGQRPVEGRMDLGDGVSAQHGGAMR